MQSAILYNVAAFRIGRISLEDAFGESTEKEHGIAELEVNSIANLDSGLGVESLVALVPVLRAQLLVIKKEWAAADRLYAESISGAAAQGQRRIAARYLAEQAHCHAMLGFRDSANALVASAVSQLIDRTDLDDRAACHARLSLCLTILGNTTESALHHGRAKEVRADFVAHQQAVRPKVVSMAEAG
jgi:hypothetical protein